MSYPDSNPRTESMILEERDPVPRPPSPPPAPTPPRAPTPPPGDLDPAPSGGFAAMESTREADEEEETAAAHEHFGNPDDDGPLNENVQNGQMSYTDMETGEEPSRKVTFDADGGTADAAVVDLDEREQYRDTMFFINDPEKRVDYVLSYRDVKDAKKLAKNDATRKVYEDNLLKFGLDVELQDKADSVDGEVYYMLVHAPWEVLLTGAELLHMRKRLKMDAEKTKAPKMNSFMDESDEETFEEFVISSMKTLEEKIQRTLCCNNSFRAGEDIVPDDGDFFTSPFSKDRIDIFDIPNKETFFSNAERSLIVKEILDRSAFTPDGSDEMRFGIFRLIQEKIYLGAFPLHEGTYKPKKDKPDMWVGEDKDRARLYESWARPGRWYCYQPLHLIRRYFGEKIGLYFAWLGFYTQMLIPAAIFGVIVFVYGIITLWDDPVSGEICDADGMGATVMCPQCNMRCSYWKLEGSCIFSRITYLFDNYGTVAFTVFMGIWSTCFLEFWKRNQKELEYEWDVQEFEAQERMRPEFEFKVKKKKENPITKIDEPYVPGLNKCCRMVTSMSIILFFVLVVVAAIVGVLIYRVVIVVILYGADIEAISSWAKIITSLTASVINLIIIIILGLIYRRVAYFLTEIEMHRTETEFEDSYTFKMFMFQFVNFYGTTFYIAFFKGKFRDRPGSTEYSLFGDYQPETCDPAGCMIDLVIQLLIVMVGKQTLNNFKELLVPFVFVKCKTNKGFKAETADNLYMRWEQDQDLKLVERLGLFEEYLEMVIQFGFVTIFVAAFPLAPFFALMNNIIEIRLDAYKFVSQFQRAPATKAQDIGMWYGILQGISFISVISNACIIAWTSDFIPKMVYYFFDSDNRNLSGFMNSSLSVFHTSNFTDNTRPDDPKVDEFGEVESCRYIGYQEPYYPYETTKVYWHVLCARLAFIVVYEHACFLVTWIITYMIPDVPADVKRLMLYEKALNKHLTFKRTLEQTHQQGARRRSTRIRLSEMVAHGANANDHDNGHISTEMAY